MVKKLIFCLIGLIFLTFVVVLFKLDPSTTLVNPLVIPDVRTQEYTPRPPIVLVSYADGPDVFYKNQSALSASAADKGFDIIYNYRRGHMDPHFYAKNKHILTQERGSGYWLWKPYFILKTMNELPDNAIIFYADSGVVLKKPITKILEEMKKYDMVLVGHGRPVPLSHHLKKEAYKVFKIPLSSDVLSQQNVWAFFLCIRNTKENREFVAKWLEACESADAITDVPFDPNNQIPHFSGHQNDQSLLSTFVALDPHKKLIIRRNIMRNEYGIHNFHRHPNHEFTSPLFLMAGMPQWVGTLLWNNVLMEWARKWISYL